MLLKCLFIVRKSDSSKYPELLDAWDEFSVDENEHGFEEACIQHLESIGKEVEASQVVSIEVDEEAIRKILLPNAVVKGKVCEPD